MARAPVAQVPIEAQRASRPIEAQRASRGRKRERILDAAIRVFARRGYHGARVSDIATEAGIAYGLVYHYFENKDELLDTLFEDRWNAFLAVVERIVEEPGSSAEKLRAVAALILFAYRRHPEWVKVLVFEICRSSRFSEPEQIRAVGRLFQAVARIVRTGQGSGELRQDLDAELACLAFIGALETMITSQVLGVMQLPDRHGDADAEAVRTVVELFLGGLASRSAR